MGVRSSKLGKFFVRANCRGLKRLKGPLVTPRGYVPICVGLEDEPKRFMVRATRLGDADFSELLWRSAEEYGFSNEGVLRIPCGAKDFEELMVNKRSNKPKVFRVKPI